MLLLVALCVRIYYLHLHVVVLETEGAGYAHQAENLLKGRGFESYLYPRPDLEHCWLQAILIAAIGMVTRDLDAATHLISLISGTVAVFWIFLLAKRLYGIWAAWIAAVVAAFHPLLVALSTTGYAEALAMALELGAIYWSIRLFEKDGRWAWLIAGSLWGLSYLNRTECLVLPLATAGLYLLRVVWNKTSLIAWARQSAQFLLVFALFVSPMCLFFYHYTGKVLFEGKNLFNYTVGQRELDGKNPDVAGRELTPSLQEVGPSLDTSRYTDYSPYPTRPADLARYFFRMARYNRSWVLHSVFDARYFGALPLTLLALLGLVSGPWSSSRLFRELYFVGLSTYIVITLFAAQIQVNRFGFQLLPFMILWASHGIEWVMNAIHSLAGKIKANATVGAWSAKVAVICLILIILRVPAKTIPYMWEFNTGWAPNNSQKEAGSWLESVAPGLKSAYGTAPFCYYADSFEWIMPYTDSQTALRYFHLKNPDYIYLDSGRSGYTPYYDDWLKNGIPDHSAILIYEKQFGPGSKVRIYRWDHSSQNSISSSNGNRPAPQSAVDPAGGL